MRGAEWPHSLPRAAGTPTSQPKALRGINVDLTFILSLAQGACWGIGIFRFLASVNLLKTAERGASIKVYLASVLGGVDGRQ